MLKRLRSFESLTDGDVSYTYSKVAVKLLDTLLASGVPYLPAGMVSDLLNIFSFQLTLILGSRESIALLRVDIPLSVQVLEY